MSDAIFAEHGMRYTSQVCGAGCRLPVACAYDIYTLYTGWCLTEPDHSPPCKDTHRTHMVYLTGRGGPEHSLPFKDPPYLVHRAYPVRSPIPTSSTQCASHREGWASAHSPPPPYTLSAAAPWTSSTRPPSVSRAATHPLLFVRGRHTWR